MGVFFFMPARLPALAIYSALAALEKFTPLLEERLGDKINVVLLSYTGWCKGVCDKYTSFWMGF